MIINIEKEPHVLLIRRKKFPSIGKFAFPGGHYDYGESAEECTLRELREETNIFGLKAKLFNVYGDPQRDPRGHYISFVHSVDVNEEKALKSIQAGDDASSAQFIKIREIINKPDEFAFDHHKILNEYIKKAYIELN